MTPPAFNLTAMALASAVTLIAAPASADIFSTLATFQSVGNAPNYAWTQAPHAQNGAITSLATAGVTNMTIHFSSTPVQDNHGETIQNLGAFGDIPAELVVTGAGQGVPTSFGHIADFPNVPATFSFIYTGAQPIFVNGANHFAGETLLRFFTPYFYFTKPSFFGAAFSSDFGSFGSLGETVFGGLTQQLFSPFTIHDEVYWPWVDSYQAQLTSGTIDAHVPEPSIWALLVLAFGAIGVALRNRTPRRLPA